MTKPSEWKKTADETKMIELPSGNSILVRRPSLVSMMRRGIIPNGLYSVAMKALEGKAQDMKPEVIKPFLDFLALFVSEAAIEPKIVLKDVTDDNQVSIDDLADEDIFAIWLGSQSIGAKKDQAREEESKKLETFREEPVGDSNGSGSDKISSPAVGASSDK